MIGLRFVCSNLIRKSVIICGGFLKKNARGYILLPKVVSYSTNVSSKSQIDEIGEPREIPHIPVMLDEVVKYLDPKPGK